MRKIQARRVPSALLALALAVAVIVPSALPAHAEVIDGPWTYNPLTGGISRITGYDGPGGHVTIPAQLGGQPVEFGLAHEVFAGNEDVTRVTVPSSVTSIPDRTFAGTVNLARVDLPSGVTRIGKEAFLNSGVTSIDLPSSLTVIDNRAFRGTASLEDDIAIPEGVTRIGSEAFSGSAITSVTFPSTVTTIENDAFSDTLSLAADIVIPEGVTEISSATFADSAITSITFPSTLTSIGAWAFAGTHNMESEVVLPEGLTTIHNLAFNGSRLTAVNIPSTVTSIGRGAFMATPNLESDIVIPSGVTEIADRLFAASEITSVTLPAGLTSIGDYAFERTPNLSSSIAIPDSVTEIGEYSFYDSAITSVNLPNALTSVGRYAFFKTPSLSSDIVIPDGVTEIPVGLFYDSAITSVTFHDGVEVIEDNAFYGNSLTEVTLPESIISAGSTPGWGAQTQPGLTFRNWHTQPQPASLFDDYTGSPVNFSTLGGEGITVYAHWSPINITLHGNAADADMTGLVTSANYGDTVAFGTPTRPNHVFLGWADAANPAPGAPLAGGDDEHSLIGDVELFAQWVLADYEITLRPNGDSVTGVDPVVGADHGEVITLGTPSREHFTFAGWSEVADPAPGATLIGGDDEYTVTGDAEFFAQWDPILYDITLDDGFGGTTVVEGQSGQTLDRPDRVIRPLHAFAGWFDQDGNEWNFGEDVVLEDVTLRASWTPRGVEHDSEVNAGGTLGISGSGFEPDDIITVAFEDGEALGVVEASEDGTFALSAVIPENLSAGEYSLVVSGSVTGSSTTTIGILSASSGSNGSGPGNTSDGDSTGPNDSNAPDGGELPRTGAESVVVPLAVAASALLAGLGAVFIAWRRRQAI